MGRRTSPAVLVAFGCVALSAAVAPVPSTDQVSAQEAPAPNPDIEESCGVDVTLVLDASGSINSSNAVEDVRNAADAFLDALQNTSSTARVTQFGTVSAELAPRTVVDDASLGQGGALANALKGYYNPIPPRVPPQDFRQYDGSGNPLSASNYGTPSNGNNQYTNWDQALDQAGTGAPPELVLFVTDGDPTAFDFNQPGDPFSPGPPPDVAFRTDRSSEAQQVTLDRAVQEANQIKANSRILAVGVGEALGNPASANRLVQVSGPQVVRDAGLADLDSLNDVDVALVTDFEDLAQFLRSVVLQLCSPSLTIRKLAQTAEDSTYEPAPGWSMTVTPTALPPGTGFRWILPATATGASATVVTDTGGFAQFQWEPTPPESDSQAIVQEVLLPGYTAGRPGIDDDFRCEFRDEDGNVREVVGDLSPTLTFTLNPIGQEIGTCTVWNSFNYNPTIAITKVNAPTAVRGDINPPTTVTSTYEVTIPPPGNTPLSNVVVTDDKCGPVLPPPGGSNPGDTDDDGLLDLTETWLFTCLRPTVVSRAAAPTAPQTIINTATVTGTDPTGEIVTATATDDVNVYFPAITLTKLVNGAESAIIEPPATATYTYAATNTGGTDLGSVTLTDDTPPCTSPTRGPDTPPGNNDDILDIGETWNFTCTSSPTADVVNVATVEGTPLNPETGAPFTGNNPVVEAEDSAEVDVINPNIELTKSVDPEVVLLDPDGTAEPVTYEFVATNTGTPSLNRPGATTGGPSATDPGWIVDGRCTSPAIFVDGDTDGDELLDTDEAWTFTCPGSVTATTRNIALIVAQPSDDTTGQPLPGVDPVGDLATALVEVLRPGITIDKTALVGVVLDENIDPRPMLGPDAAVSRPAMYRYEVNNTGNVELSLAANPPTDDICVDPGPVFVEGDTDDDDLLDVDETWIYTCETPLDRDQHNLPFPVGDLSATVRNTVGVTGIPFFEGALVTDPTKFVTAGDTASVQVIEPGLTITKTASAAVVLPGTAVTYSYAVTNTGDVGLTLIGPEDDLCSPLEFTGGDRPPFNGILEGANSGTPETFTYECTRTLDTPVSPDVVHLNTVVVGGIDPLGNLYVATDTAEVRVFEPAIALTKTVSDELVLSGTTVTYDFTVTNVGASPIAADDVLADIQLTDTSDPPVPTCTSPTFVGGDTNGDDLLPRAPEETWTYQCTAAITEPTTDVAVVVGTGGIQFELPVEVSAEAAAFVQPFTPAIEVTKTASPTQLLGSGPVTYTYTVRNTGDVPLADVAARITDDKCAPLTLVSGDEDGDGLLDTPNSIFEDSGDEIWTFTCTATVSATTTNTVVVTGTPTDPGGTPLCTAPANGPVGLLQVASPCDVTDNATAVVTVVAPATVIIVKRTTEPTTARFALSFNIPPAAMPPGACDPSYPTTCIPPPPPDLNCSDITARAFTVLPPDPHDFDGDSDGVGCENDAPVTLGRDESFTLRNVMPGTYTVTEPAAGPWRLQSLECTDPTGDSVVTIADRQASIVVAPGETVTCTFTNSPTGRLPATGNRQLGASLAASLVLVGLGAMLGSVDWRRRRALRR